MKSKILNILLILTSLFGYLEWTKIGYAFLFQAEAEIFHRLFTHSREALHPVTIIPFVGHVLLFFTLFQKKPGELLTCISIGILGLLMGYLFVIGLLGLHFKIALSAFPFLVVAVLALRYHRQMNPEAKLNKSTLSM